MLRIFIVAAKSKTFREASEILRISPQTVTRAIVDLERLFNEPLFHRDTRNNHITPFGSKLIEGAENLIFRVDEFFRSVAPAEVSKINGEVRIAIPSALGRRHFIDMLRPLFTQHPYIRIDVIISDADGIHTNEETDIGIRFGTFSDRRNIARVVGSASFQIVGTPELLERVGIPYSIDQLSALPVTGHFDRSTGKVQPWEFKSADMFSPSNPILLTNDPELQLEAILQGVAIGRLSNHLIDDHIQSGKIVTILEELTSDRSGVYVYRPYRAPTANRVKIVFEYLIDCLSNHKSFNN